MWCNEHMTYEPNQPARKRGPVGVSGFTLLELLVVLAITSVLLTLIFQPLITGFNLTSRAGTQVASQSDARDAMRTISSLLTNAAVVYDNSNTPINIWVKDQAGNQYPVPTPFGMVEYIAPSRQLDQSPGSLAIDPTTGLPIYPKTASDGQAGFALPLAPGRTLGRIWIGLRNCNSQSAAGAANPDAASQSGMPLVPYGNRWSDPAQVSPQNDNRYTVYRAEVQAYMPDPFNAGKYIPNLSLFHTAADAGGTKDARDGALILDDPNFPYDTSLAGANDSKGDRKWAVPGWKDLNGDGKVEIFENWAAAAKSIFDLNKADTIAFDRDDNGNLLYPNNVNGSMRPNIRPLVNFAPAYVENETAAPASLGDAGSESPSAAAIAYDSQYAAWTTGLNAQLPVSDNPPNPNNLAYKVLVYRAGDTTTDPLSLANVNYFLTNGNGRIVQANGPISNAPPDPNNLQATADVGPDPDPVTGVWHNANPAFAFTVDPQRGLVNFAFPHSVLFYDPNNPGTPAPMRYDPNVIDANITTAYGARFIDLRNISVANYNGAPLNPAGAVSPIAQFSTPPGQLESVRIVPGSERIYGPDQRPGPHYGWRVQYTRVPASTASENIGPNQYKILYEDAANAGASPDPLDPRVRVGFIQFDSLPDVDLSTPNITENLLATPPVYKLNGLPTAKLGAGPNNTPQAEPADPVEVNFSFQMNRPNDVVKIDYYTRELMNIILSVRYYDPATATPQQTDLTERVRLRNLQR